LSDTRNRVATAAAEDASHGVAARAARLVEAAREALAAPADEQRRLRLEGVAREIDAGFDLETLPDDLRNIRTQVVAELQ
jgi:MoxR-like ATPase